MAKYVYTSRPKFSILIASAEGVAERFSKQYSDGAWPKQKAIVAALAALPSTASPADVDKLIGNQSWTHPYCDSCGQYKDRAVEFENGDHSVIVCDECLDTAKATLSSQQRAGGE